MSDFLGQSVCAGANGRVFTIDMSQSREAVSRVLQCVELRQEQEQGSMADEHEDWDSKMTRVQHFRRLYYDMQRVWSVRGKVRCGAPKGETECENCVYSAPCRGTGKGI